MLEADDKACSVEAEVFLKDPITSTLPGCHEVTPPVNLESLYQSGDSTGMAVGSLSDWLANESEGDAADSQIVSIDVLALSSKGETCMQLLLFSQYLWCFLSSSSHISIIGQVYVYQ